MSHQPPMLPASGFRRRPDADSLVTKDNQGFLVVYRLHYRVSHWLESALPKDRLCNSPARVANDIVDNGGYRRSHLFLLQKKKKEQ